MGFPKFFCGLKIFAHINTILMELKLWLFFSGLLLKHRSIRPGHINLLVGVFLKWKLVLFKSYLGWRWLECLDIIKPHLCLGTLSLIQIWVIKPTPGLHLRGTHSRFWTWIIVSNQFLLIGPLLRNSFSLLEELVDLLLRLLSY